MMGSFSNENSLTMSVSSMEGRIKEESARRTAINPIPPKHVYTTDQNLVKVLCIVWEIGILYGKKRRKK
jgi:hypothetical protein